MVMVPSVTQVPSKYKSCFTCAMYDLMKPPGKHHRTAKMFLVQILIGVLTAHAHVSFGCLSCLFLCGPVMDRGHLQGESHFSIASSDIDFKACFRTKKTLDKTRSKPVCEKEYMRPDVTGNTSQEAERGLSSSKW